MKFHFNEVALRHTAQSRLPDREGRLLYRSAKGSYKERWFRLHGNLLFYFRTNDYGAVADHDPVGVFVLAKYSVEMEPIADRPFVFTMMFEGEEGRKHYFSGQTMQQCLDWIGALQVNSYEAVRSKYESLRREVYRVTGKDPVKEKMAISSKPKLKSESRHTKFYYDSGLDSVDSLISARSSVRKSARPSELQNSKPADQSKLDLSVMSKERNVSSENALITLSPDDVQKRIVGDQVTPINPVLQFDIVDAIPAIKPAQSHLESSEAIQQTPVPMVSLVEPTRMPLSQPVAFRQSLSSMIAAQQNMARGPVMSFGTVPIAQSDIARMPCAMPPSSGSHVLRQNVPRLSSVQPTGTQWRQYGTASSHVPFPPLISAAHPSLMQQTAIRSDFRQQPSAGAGKMDASSFSALHNFQSSAVTSHHPLQTVVHQSSEQHVKRDSPYEWRAHEMNKSHTSPELMSFHKWETFDE